MEKQPKDEHESYINTIVIPTRKHIINSISEKTEIFRKHDIDLWNRIRKEFYNKHHVDFKRDVCHDLEPRYCEDFGQGKFELKWFFNTIGPVVILEVNEYPESYIRKDYDLKHYAIHSIERCYTLHDNHKKDAFPHSIDLLKPKYVNNKEPQQFEIYEVDNMFKALNDELASLHYVFVSVTEDTGDGCACMKVIRIHLNELNQWISSTM